MAKSRQVKLGFTVHGDFMTNFFREHMLEGDPQKTILMILDSFIGIDIDQARQLLRGEMKMEGINTVSFVKDKGYSDKEMKQMCFIYRKEREIPGVFKKADVKKWMDKIPVPEKERTANEELCEVMDAVEARGYLIQQVDDAKGYTPWNGKGRRKVMVRDDIQLGKSGRSVIVEDALSSFIKNLHHEDDLEQPATAAPLPYTDFTPDDANHFTWLMSPEGVLYKIPYQAHDDWFVKYTKYIDPTGTIFDEEGLGNPYKHGWTRFSGGIGLGLVVAMPKDTSVRPPKSCISRHMRRYAGNTFTFEDDDRRVFEINIDFDRALRLLNESYQEQNK